MKNDEQNSVTGEDWLRGLLKRHSNDISVPLHEATSIACASSFNE